jgi:hypothetical protein
MTWTAVVYGVKGSSNRRVWRVQITGFDADLKAAIATRRGCAPDRITSPRFLTRAEMAGGVQDWMTKPAERTAS